MGRLTRDVVPRRYEVALSIDPDGARYGGRVKITADVVLKTRRVTLHALDLEITRAAVDGRELPQPAVVIDAAAETVTLELPEALEAGPCVLELAYAGRMNTQMRGLYQSRSTYQGKEEKAAFTHLEPTHARRLLPCFDEPDLKAVFELSVTAPEGLKVLSNMPEAGRSARGGLVSTRFEETPRMSTYLLAVAAARLEGRSRQVDGTLVTVWAGPEGAGQADFALDAAGLALGRLNSYFGLRYQLPKLDLVAVPDFASGAMENWGAIFFRDSALLIDPKLSSTRAKRRVAEVVAHEVVHQWFGNLVTMSWWSDLWLNEAFATWLANKVVDLWKPAWQTWLEFQQGQKTPLSIDGLRCTRAVCAQAATTAEIQAMFDPLTYEKGGAILRMLESFLGEDAFRRGIEAYIRRHQFGNAASDDLWRELEAVSGVEVLAMAQGWLTQPGYPEVTARPLPGRRLKLSQKRFSAHGEASGPGLWKIPVVISYRLRGGSGVRQHRMVLSQAQQEIVLPGEGELLWAYPNGGETGYYRVGFPEGLPEALKEDVAALGPAERLGLMNHLWAQARAGAAGVDAFMDLLWALKGDLTRVVVEDAAGYLRSLNDTLVEPADRELFARRAGEWLEPRARSLGWEARPEDDDEVRLTRAAVLSALAALKGDVLAEQTRRRLDLVLQDPGALDPLLAPIVLNAEARRGGADLFETYRRKMGSAATPEQRDLYLRALSEFRGPQLSRLLELTLTSEIRGQDAWKPFLHLLADPAAQAEAWAFVKSHWGALKDKLGPRGATRVVGATASLLKEEWLAGVRDFFSAPENRVAIAQRTLEQSLESIELGLRFKRQAPALSRWLSSPR
ncbi:MAG: M1 family metallopeptidase [Elusimicrobiota bacterium]